MSDQVIVRMEHIRKADLCAKGARYWFESNGLSWSDFLTNGIAAEKVEVIGDAMADRVCAVARQESSNGR